MAANSPMIATTIISSMSVNPRPDPRLASRFLPAGLYHSKRFYAVSFPSVPSSSATTGAMIDSLSPLSNRREPGYPWCSDR